MGWVTVSPAFIALAKTVRVDAATLYDDGCRPILGTWSAHESITYGTIENMLHRMPPLNDPRSRVQAYLVIGE